MSRKVIVAIAAAISTLAGSVVAATTVTAPAQAAATTPVRAAFEYEWFPETEQWATQFTPSLGKYDSSNRAILAAHVSMAKYAGLDALISSWWGQGSPTDQRLPLALDAADAQGLKIAPYFERASSASATYGPDFTYLYGLSSGPAWLKVNGKPVLFIYNTGTEGSCAGLERMVTANAGRFYLSAKVFNGYATCPVKTDAFHQYGPATPYSQHLPYSSVVSPGFYKFNETAPRLARDLARFKTDLARQVASGAQWQLVTSLNEWGEGTAVEPAEQWQSASGFGDYLDAMRAAYVTGPPPPTSSSSATSSSSSSSSSSTSTSTPPSGAIKVAAAGDIACKAADSLGTRTCAQRLVGDTIAGLNPDAVLTLGDTQYDSGEYANFTGAYDPAYGRFKAKTYPAPGNHEWLTTNAQGYRDYFRTGTPAVVNVDRLYYSFNLGAWHFISLESDCSKVGGCAAGNPQYTWLQADLAANDGKPTVVYWHHPRYTSDTRGDATNMVPFWNLFVADRDVQVALSGHTHNYERFAPMGVTGPDPAGLRQFVVGTGGKNHTCITSGFRVGSQARDCTSYGPLELTLNNDGSYAWRFVPASGTGTYTDQGSQPRR